LNTSDHGGELTADPELVVFHSYSTTIAW
jgi:hypothetical protein